MDEIWAADRPVRVREVLEAINHARDERDLAYTTVQTVMDVLHRKGWLARVKDGKANLYEATATREDYVAGLVAEALAFTDDRPAALLRFVQDLDPAEAGQLRAALDAARSPQCSR